MEWILTLLGWGLNNILMCEIVITAVMGGGFLASLAMVILGLDTPNTIWGVL